MLQAMFDGSMLFFSVPALAGTAFFILRMVLMLMGGHGDFHAGDVHADTGLGDGDTHGSTGAFNLLSVQGITAFLMGFGWVGLGARVSLQWDFGLSALLGLGGGIAMVWIIGWMFRGMYALQSSGNIRIDEAVGRDASVYVTVPAKGQGRGQVRVVIDDRARVYNAVTEGDAIPSQTRVRVVQANDDHTVTVTAVV